MAKKKRLRMRDRPLIDRCGGDEEACSVAEHYLKYHPRWRGPKPKELESIDEALEHYTVEECKLAIDGLHLSEYHNGKNDTGRSYLRIGLAFKEATIDDHIARAVGQEKRKDRERQRVIDSKKDDQRREDARKEMMNVDIAADLRRALRSRPSS